jgi:hypothetical protein
VVSSFHDHFWHICRADVQAIAPDLPSHRTPTAGLAEDAAEVRDAIRACAPPVAAVGWSYGGSVISLAGRSPSPISCRCRRHGCGGDLRACARSKPSAGADIEDPLGGLWLQQAGGLLGLPMVHDVVVCVGSSVELVTDPGVSRLVGLTKPVWLLGSPLNAIRTSCIAAVGL